MAKLPIPALSSVAFDSLERLRTGHVLLANFDILGEILPQGQHMHHFVEG
jgi:hypothetical protein